MSDWQRGDEAICICGDSWWRDVTILGLRAKRSISHGPRSGETFKVIRVVVVDAEIYLELDSYPLEGWHSGSFRKPDRREGSNRAWRKLFQRHRARTSRCV